MFLGVSPCRRLKVFPFSKSGHYRDGSKGSHGSHLQTFKTLKEKMVCWYHTQNAERKNYQLISHEFLVWAWFLRTLNFFLNPPLYYAIHFIYLIAWHFDVGIETYNPVFDYWVLHQFENNNYYILLLRGSVDVKIVLRFQN